MSAEADRIVRRIYAGTMSLSKAARLIDDMLAEERKKAAERAVEWYNRDFGSDVFQEHEDDDEWWNNGLRAAILGKDTP